MTDLYMHAVMPSISGSEHLSGCYCVRLEEASEGFAWNAMR
jgi:hypothetical protein